MENLEFYKFLQQTSIPRIYFSMYMQRIQGVPKKGKMALDVPNLNPKMNGAKVLYTYLYIKEKCNKT